MENVLTQCTILHSNIKGPELHCTSINSDTTIEPTLLIYLCNGSIQLSQNTGFICNIDGVQELIFAAPSPEAELSHSIARFKAQIATDAQELYSEVALTTDADYGYVVHQFEVIMYSIAQLVGISPDDAMLELRYLEAAAIAIRSPELLSYLHYMEAVIKHDSETASGIANDMAMFNNLDTPLTALPSELMADLEITCQVVSDFEMSRSFNTLAPDEALELKRLRERGYIKQCDQLLSMK